MSLGSSITFARKLLVNLDACPVKREAAALRNLLKPVENLHQNLAFQPIAPLCNKMAVEDQVSMHVSSCCTVPKMAEAVTRSFTDHFKSRDATITGLRATVFYILTGNSPIPVLEWTERDAEGMALFKFDESRGVCSFVIHYGTGYSEAKCPRRWKRSAIIWNVVDTGHLKDLLGASQGMLEIMEWSVDDILNLYCKSRPPKVSNETYHTCNRCTLTLA